METGGGNQSSGSRGTDWHFGEPNSICFIPHLIVTDVGFIGRGIEKQETYYYRVGPDREQVLEKLPCRI